MSFDQELAKVTVHLSRSAYRDADRARAETEALGLDDFHFFAHAPNEAISAAGPGHLYVAFRGTEANPRDWVQNSRFGPVRGELGGKVHSGFHSGLSDLWPGIEQVARATALPVVVTGHSLGGALATLAAARLDEAGLTVAGVYTYGRPRVGHADFAGPYSERLAQVTFSVINHVDVVTRVPLLIQRYRHVGRRVYFDRGGKLHDGAGAWKIALDDVLHRITHLGRISEAARLSTHDMSAYVGLIEGL